MRRHASPESLPAAATAVIPARSSRRIARLTLANRSGKASDRLTTAGPRRRAASAITQSIARTTRRAWTRVGGGRFPRLPRAPSLRPGSRPSPGTGGASPHDPGDEGRMSDRELRRCSRSREPRRSCGRVELGCRTRGCRPAHRSRSRRPSPRTRPPWTCTRGPGAAAAGRCGRAPSRARSACPQPPALGQPRGLSTTPAPEPSASATVEVRSHRLTGTNLSLATDCRGRHRSPGSPTATGWWRWRESNLSQPSGTFGNRWL